MKFDCDKREDRAKAKRLARREWHDFFAIWPRRVGRNDCRCLETIQRRQVYVEVGYVGWLSWQYRAKP